jgi:hypothetical protein|tara:strand:+ start:4909 stop:5196 length:288 start_codon:yes stop_codon:yes gene_type:complete
MDDEFEEFKDEEIEAILREALKSKLEDRRKVPRRNQLNQALVNTLGEFLTCWKIMGYDYEGNPVNMTIYKEKVQKSALDNQFVEEVSKFMGSKMT